MMAKNIIEYEFGKSFKNNKLKTRIQQLEIDNTERIFIGSLSEIIDRWPHDELVEHRFKEEKCLGMNKGLTWYPDDERVIIVRSDSPRYKKLDSTKIEEQILLTIFHEEGHLLGLDNEYDAEEFALIKLVANQ